MPGPPHIMLTLLRGLYWFDEALQNALSAQGFPVTPRAQSMVLANLAMGENRPIRLARNLGVTRQAISQLLRQMQMQGLIIVKPHPIDRRARVVEYSPSALKIRRAAQRALTELENELEGRIGRAKVRALREALGAEWGAPPNPKKPKKQRGRATVGRRVHA